MADRKPGPFSRLDTSLMRSTQASPAADPVAQQSGREETQIARSPDLTPTRPATTKIGYRISIEAVDAIDDIRRLLQRKHRLKTTRQKIVEEAILAAYDDLVRNEQGSHLARRIAGSPEGQTSADQERRKSS